MIHETTSNHDERKIILANIEVLRFFAAINVVLYHVIGIADKYGYPVNVLRLLDGWGACGVDLFFVISGFIMTHSQSSRTCSEFMLSRIRRLVPLYWLFSIVFVLLNLLIPSLFRGAQPTVLHSLSSLFFVSNIVLGKEPIIYVGWTLELEMIFYSLFSLGLLFFKGRNLYVYAISSVVLLSFVDDKFFIALEFGFGVIAAMLYRRTFFVRFGPIIFFLGLIAFGFSIVYKPVIDRVLLWGVPAFFVVYGSLVIPAVKSEFLIRLGGASYSVYLTQVFSLPAFYKIAAQFSHFLLSDLYALFATGFTVLFGWLVYSYVEKPLIDRLKFKRVDLGV